MPIIGKLPDTPNNRRTIHAPIDKIAHKHQTAIFRVSAHFIIPQMPQQSVQSVNFAVNIADNIREQSGKGWIKDIIFSLLSVLQAAWKYPF